MGANGAAPTSFDEIVDAAKLIAEASAEDATSALMSPRTYAQYANLADGQSQPLARPTPITKIAFRQTSNIAVAETQGSATDASSVYVGGWPNLWIGVRLDPQIQVLRERYSDCYQFGFLASARVDVKVAQEGAFTRIIDLVP